MGKAAKRKTPIRKKNSQPIESAEDKKRKDWEINNELISEAFFSSVLKNKKFPTYTALAKQLGMNECTIRRHLKDEDMFDELKVKLRALKNKALLTVAIKAIKGDDVNWAKLFFEVTDEVKDKESSITININGKKVN